MEIRPDRWEVIQRLFHEAAEVPVTERRAFLEAACGDDLSLIADVLALLERDSAPSPLDRGITEVSGEVFDSPDLAGQVIGPYRLFDVIGRGGMGVVYRAERTDLGNPVAIKTLREAWGID